MNMATPLMSDKARAWLASVKGVPPNQLTQQAIRAAQTGMISFGDAIALKQMADRISNSAAQKDAPSPNSVVQDLKQQVQTGRDVMYSGVGALPTAAPQPMESGIASLPAPVMDDAQYAGGGIVAFAEAGAVDSSKYSPEFLKIVEDVIRREGGDKVTNIKGDRGGVTKFGISQAANPDVDVPNLTKDQAIDLYYDRYWKKSGAEKIAANDPRAAEIIMDTAVHHGPPAAINMFEQAKGDPARLLDIREERLRAQANQPGQKKFGGGWESRIQDLRSTLAPAGAMGAQTDGSFRGMIDRSRPPVTRPAMDAQQRGVDTGFAGIVGPASEDYIKSQLYGPNWRTRYQGMTHTTLADVSGPSASRVPPAAPKPAPKVEAAPAQDYSFSPVAEDAPLLSEIDVDAEMRKQGMSEQDRLLMLANAGFNMAQAASQPGATFLGSAAVGGGSAAQGLASLSADQRARRRALEEAAMRRQEAVAGIKLKERGLSLEERLGLGRLSSEAIKNSAVLRSLAIKAEEAMKTDPQAIAAQQAVEKEVNPARKAQAQARYDAIRQRYMGDIMLLQQQTQVTGMYPGASVE